MGRTKRKRKNKIKTGQNVIETFDSKGICFMKWLKQNHFENITNLQLKKTNYCGYGLFATKTILKNCDVISVPIDLLIRRSQIECEYPCFRNAFLKTQFHSLVAYLVLERCQYENNLKTKWFPFIQMLDVEMDFIPFCWHSIESSLQYLTPKSFLKQICFQNQQMQQIIDDCVNFYNECFQYLQLNSLPLSELYRWAYSIVHSRSLYVCSKLFPDTTVLAPFFDFCNHSNQARVTTCVEDNNFKLKTLDLIKANTQIYIKYHHLNNRHSLNNYGFVTIKQISQQTDRRAICVSKEDSIELDYNTICQLYNQMESTHSIRTKVTPRLNLLKKEGFLTSNTKVDIVWPNNLHDKQEIIFNISENDFTFEIVGYDCSKFPVEFDICWHIDFLNQLISLNDLTQNDLKYFIYANNNTDCLKERLSCQLNGIKDYYERCIIFIKSLLSFEYGLVCDPGTDRLVSMLDQQTVWYHLDHIEKTPLRLLVTNEICLLIVIMSLIQNKMKTIC